MTHFARAALYGGVAVALFSSISAWAQDAPAAGTTPKDETGDTKSGSVEKVVITATRRQTVLQKTPVAVTAISSKELEQRNNTSLLDVATFVPNLSIGSRAGTGSADGNVAIRGMGVDAQDSQASVGVYVDDVFFAGRQGNLLGLMDVERIEVLRGPQGTLFGRNTVAGAIQYVTRRPDDEFGGYLIGTLGNFGRTDAQGAMSIPLGDDFALRIAGLYNNRDGYIKDLFTGEDRGAEESKAARIRVVWMPTDRLSVDVKAEYVNQSTNGRAVLVDFVNPNAQFPALSGLFGTDLSNYASYVSATDDSFGGFNAPDYFKFNFAAARGVVNYDFSDSLSLKSISAISSYRPRLAQDLDDTPLDILALSAPRSNTEVFTQELQLTGTALADRLFFILGAYYFDYQQRIDPNYQVKLGPLPPQDAFGNPGLDITSEALYGRVGYDLTDQLSVELGVRYTNEETSSFLINETPPLTNTFIDWSPHVGVNFEATEDIFLYAKASKGFRAGGFTANRALPGGGNPFDPEEAWTYEAGARLELFDRTLRVNPTVFFTDWSEIQFNQLVTGQGGSPAVTTQNAGDAEIRGFELESLWRVTDRFDLSATLALLDAEYTRVEPLVYNTFPTGWSFHPVFGPIPNSVVVLPNITLATPLQRAPEVKYTLGARYTHPIGEASLVGSVDYAWTDDQWASVTIADQVLLPAYSMLNARLQYNAPDDRWSLAVFGTNLLDEYWLIGGVGFGHGYTGGAEELDPGRPREYGLELRFRFGSGT